MRASPKAARILTDIPLAAEEQIPDLGYDGAPAPDRTGRHVMAQILATTGAQTSATQTLRALQDQATSLAQLAPIHETLVQTAQRHRWAAVIAGSGLTVDQLRRVEASPAYGPLVAALRRADYDGHPMQRVLPALVAAAPLDVPNDTTDDAAAARDLAAVLHHRVTGWHERAMPSPGHRPEPLIGGLITPAGQLDAHVPADQRGAIEQIEALMTSRVDAVTRQVLRNPPTWLRRLGTPPADPRRRPTWVAAVELIAAFATATWSPNTATHSASPSPPSRTNALRADAPSPPAAVPAPLPRLARARR